MYAAFPAADPICFRFPTAHLNISGAGMDISTIDLLFAKTGTNRTAVSVNYGGRILQVLVRT